MSGGRLLPSYLNCVVVKGNVISRDTSGFSDPYVVVDIINVKTGKSLIPRTREKRELPQTDIKKATLTPQWNQLIKLDIPADLDEADFAPLPVTLASKGDGDNTSAAKTGIKITFTVFDWDRLGKHDFCGYAELRMADLATVSGYVPRYIKKSLDLTYREGNNSDKALYYEHDKKLGNLIVHIRGVAVHRWWERVHQEPFMLKRQELQRRTLRLSYVDVTVHDGRGLKLAEAKGVRPVCHLHATGLAVDTPPPGASGDAAAHDQQPPSKRAAVKFHTKNTMGISNPKWGDTFRIHLDPVAVMANELLQVGKKDTPSPTRGDDPQQTGGGLTRQHTIYASAYKSFYQAKNKQPTKSTHLNLQFFIRDRRTKDDNEPSMGFANVAIPHQLLQESVGEDVRRSTKLYARDDNNAEMAAYCRCNEDLGKIFVSFRTSAEYITEAATPSPTGSSTIRGTDDAASSRIDESTVSGSPQQSPSASASPTASGSPSGTQSPTVPNSDTGGGSGGGVGGDGSGGSSPRHDNGSFPSKQKTTFLTPESYTGIPMANTMFVPAEGKGAGGGSSSGGFPDAHLPEGVVGSRRGGIGGGAAAGGGEGGSVSFFSGNIESFAEVAQGQGEVPSQLGSSTMHRDHEVSIVVDDEHSRRDDEGGAGGKSNRGGGGGGGADGNRNRAGSVRWNTFHNQEADGVPLDTCLDATVTNLAGTNIIMRPNGDGQSDEEEEGGSEEEGGLPDPSPKVLSANQLKSSFDRVMRAQEEQEAVAAEEEIDVEREREREMLEADRATSEALDSKFGAAGADEGGSGGGGGSADGAAAAAAAVPSAPPSVPHSVASSALSRASDSARRRRAATSRRTRIPSMMMAGSGARPPPASAATPVSASVGAPAPPAEAAAAAPRDDAHNDSNGSLPSSDGPAGPPPSPPRTQRQRQDSSVKSFLNASQEEERLRGGGGGGGGDEALRTPPQRTITPSSRGASVRTAPSSAGSSVRRYRAETSTDATARLQRQWSVCSTGGLHAAAATAASGNQRNHQPSASNTSNNNSGGGNTPGGGGGAAQYASISGDKFFNNREADNAAAAAAAVAASADPLRPPAAASAAAEQHRRSVQRRARRRVMDAKIAKEVEGLARALREQKEAQESIMLYVNAGVATSSPSPPRASVGVRPAAAASPAAAGSSAATAALHTDPTTGLLYRVNAATAQTEWLKTPPPPPSPSPTALAFATSPVASSSPTALRGVDGLRVGGGAGARLRHPRHAPRMRQHGGATDSSSPPRSYYTSPSAAAAAQRHRTGVSGGAVVPAATSPHLRRTAMLPDPLMRHDALRSPFVDDFAHLI